MENHISRIGSHVFLKGAMEAVKLYKEAFNLEDEGELWLDDDGFLIYRELLQDGKLFLSVSEDKHMPAELKIKYPDGVKPTMMFMVCFSDENKLRKASALLSNEVNPCTKVIVNPDGSIVCDVFDIFGVYWWLCVPIDWNASFVPK